MGADAVELWQGAERIRLWLDERAEPVTPADSRLLRVLKIGEEFGEVTEALNGALGVNPRKPRRPWEDVEDELADVIVSAAVALDTISGDARAVLERRLRFLLGRVTDSSASAP